MAINTPTAPAENRNQEEVLIQKTRAEALKTASTVGGFQSDYKRMMSDMMEGKMPKNTDGASAHDSMVLDKEKLGKVIENERKMIDEVSKGNEAVKIEKMEKGKLGHNTIGGGQNDAALGKGMFEELQKPEDVDMIKQVVGHEVKGHGEAVQLKGELRLDDEKPVDHLLIHEGFAEGEGNKAIGKDISYHRPNQPKEIYREGQLLMAKLIERTSAAAVRRVMTETGDLSELQKIIDREKKSGLSPARN